MLSRARHHWCWAVLGRSNDLSAGFGREFKMHASAFRLDIFLGDLLMILFRPVENLIAHITLHHNHGPPGLENSSFSHNLGRPGEVRREEILCPGNSSSMACARVPRTAPQPSHNLRSTYIFSQNEYIVVAEQHASHR